MRFTIGENVTCDLEQLVDNRLLIQANSGGGKSWCIRRILEQTFDHVQHLVIDPEGEFGTLREQYDYILAGREGADTATDPRSARLLARRLLELGASAILNIYELKAHDRVRFVRFFLEELIDAPKALWHPVLVVVDEAHVYCPQKGDAESAGAVIDLATRGRKRGFCAVIATQRLSKLHKDAAAECNNKLIGRSALDVDMKRAAEELGFSGREEQHQLRELSPGEFFAFGPALSPTVRRVMVGGVETTHPKAGARQAFTAPPPSEKVIGLLPSLEDLPAEAEQERKDNAALRLDLATARRELTLARKERAPPDEAVIGRQVEAAVTAERRSLERLLKQQGDVGGREIKRLERIITVASKELVGAGERLAAAINGATPPPAVERPALVPVVPRREPSPSPVVPVHIEVPGGDGALSGPQQLILDALAMFESLGMEQVRKEPLAVQAGRSPASSAYTNNLGALRSLQLLSYPLPGQVALTEEGRALASHPDTVPTLAELQERWCNILSGPQADIIRALIAIYPASVGKEALAEEVERSAASSAYTNNLGRLRSLGLLAYPSSGFVVATGLLFPEGLA